MKTAASAVGCAPCAAPWTLSPWSELCLARIGGCYERRNTNDALPTGAGAGFPARCSRSHVIVGRRFGDVLRAGEHVALAQSRSALFAVEEISRKPAANAGRGRSLHAGWTQRRCLSR